MERWYGVCYAFGLLSICVCVGLMRLRGHSLRVYKGYIEYAFGLMRLDILCVYGDMRLRLKDALAMGCV